MLEVTIIMSLIMNFSILGYFMYWTIDIILIMESLSMIILLLLFMSKKYSWYFSSMFMMVIESILGLTIMMTNHRTLSINFESFSTSMTW